MEERPRRSWLARAERWGRHFEDALLMLLLSELILLASSQIVLRNLFSIGLTWADGLIRLTVLWLALLGAVAASRDRKQIAIDVLSRALPGGLRRAAAVITDLFTAVVTGLLAWYAWVFVQDAREFGDTLLNNWPAWLFQLILPFGFAAISYRYLIRTLQQLAGRD